MKGYSRFVCLVVLLGGIGCGGEKPQVSATLIPTEEGSALLFRGYVTDAEQELIGEIYNFTRRYSHVDTIDGIPVYAFYEDDERNYFYVDEAGTVWQSRMINLTNRLIPHKITTSKPVLVRYWEPVLKVEDGVGTEWEVVVDTTITAKSLGGEPFDVRYHYSAKGRYDGWGHTAIPESQSIQEVLDVNWYDIDNFIVNETTNDSLFVKRGTAHYYFDPEMGMIKYITDYFLKKGSDSYISRYGTWELIEKRFPTDGKSS